MSYVTWKIEHVPFINGTWQTAQTTTLSEVIDPKVEVSLGDNKDSFNFNLTNVAKRYDNKFNPNDKIYIYRTINSATVTSTDLIMTGVLRNTPQDYSGTNNTLKVEGYNYTELVLSALTFGDFNLIPINQALQLGLNFINATNRLFPVTWDSGNPSVRTDGTAFPNLGQKFFYKPYSTIIETYSTNKYTKDSVNYYYYVSKSNTLVWRPRTSTVQFSFNENTDDFIKIKSGKDTSKVINFVVVKGGSDPIGRPIQTIAQDLASSAKHGQKPYVLVSKTTLAKNLNENDLRASYGADFKSTNSVYPKEIDAGTSYTTTWTSSVTTTVESTSMVAGSPVTINRGSAADNKKAYLACLITHVKQVLSDEGLAYISLYKYGKLQVDISFRAGTKSWSLGDVIGVSLASLSSSVKPMRIQSISYSSNEDIYSLEEDVGSI